MLLAKPKTVFLDESTSALDEGQEFALYRLLRTRVPDCILVSIAHRGTVRGLHFQKPPQAQTKVVRVARGRIWDVCVDIRRDSPTYGHHAVVELEGGDWRQLHVPPGFAHGFCTLEDNTEITFRLTADNNREYAGGLLWNDPVLGIDWPCGTQPAWVFPVDRQWPTLEALSSPFQHRRQET